MLSLFGGAESSPPELRRAREFSKRGHISAGPWKIGRVSVHRVWGKEIYVKGKVARGVQTQHCSELAL